MIAAASRATGCDLEALEVALRQAAHAAGAKVLEELLRPVGVGRREERVLCPKCRTVTESAGRRRKRVQTLLGWIAFERSRYVCPRCGATLYPADQELGIAGTSRSPGVQRQVARLGAKEAFREVSRDVVTLADVHIARKDAERVSERIGEDIERWMEEERRALRFQQPPPPETSKIIDTFYIEVDGTGVPMVPGEVAGRKGKQEDGSAKTREAKLGCVFTQTAFDEKGRPIRDPASTTFVGAIEPAERFGWRIYGEAQRRGLYQAKRVVILSDGAEWIRNLVETHFPRVTHVIDLYHAREHLVDLCRALSGRDLKRLNHYKDRWWDDLDEGDIEKIVSEAQELLPKNPQDVKDAQGEIAYFDKNKERMRYGTFYEQGLFVGSGVIEAGCKTVIGARLKQSGMEWTVRGANAIIALRCAVLSNRFEDYWEARAM